MLELSFPVCSFGAQTSLQIALHHNPTSLFAY
jgi:hypothetical protein